MSWTPYTRTVFADPYLTWTTATGWTGHSAAGRPDAQVHVLLELASAATAIDDLAIVRSGLVEVPGLYRYGQPGDASGTRFCTAAVARDRLAELAAHAEVARFEFALPVAAGAVSQAPPAIPSTGEGRTVIGVIDRGCAFLNTCFRRAWTGPGTEHTRIDSLWDQSAAATGPHWSRPAGLGYGRELDRAAIDQLIAEHRSGRTEEDIYRSLGYLLDDDGQVLEVAHGTHVADTLAGLVPASPTGASAKPSTADRAQDCDIVFVSIPSLAPGDTTGASSGAYLLDGVRYILQRAGPYAQVVINISLGIHGGPHDGSSLLDSALDDILDDQRRHGMAIVVAAGNGAEEFWTSTGSLPVDAKAPPQDGRVWLLMPDDPTDSFVELWWRARPGPVPGQLELRVTPPATLSAEPSGWVAPGQTVLLERTPGRPVCMVTNLGAPALGSDPMALVALAPNAGMRAAARAGRWRIDMRNVGGTPVDYDLWIQRDEPPPGNDTPIQSQFDDFDDSRRGEGCEKNDLACGRRTISVGAARLSDRDASSYSAGTTDLNPSQRLPLSQCTGPVDAFGAADEGAYAIGLTAARVRSGMVWRMGGTSTAAPVVARQLVNELADPENAANATRAGQTMTAQDIKQRFLQGFVLYRGVPKVRGRPAFFP